MHQFGRAQSKTTKNARKTFRECRFAAFCRTRCTILPHTVHNLVQNMCTALFFLFYHSLFDGKHICVIIFQQEACKHEHTLVRYRSLVKVRLQGIRESFRNN